jgi:hypothetical protein
VENLLWKRLRACRKTDCGMKRLRTCRKTDYRMKRLRTCRKTDCRMKRLRTYRKTDYRMKWIFHKVCTFYNAKKDSLQDHLSWPQEVTLYLVRCTYYENQGVTVEISEEKWPNSLAGNHTPYPVLLLTDIQRLGDLLHFKYLMINCPPLDFHFNIHFINGLCLFPC